MNTEKELFTITAEECAELIQVCMKTVRFGVDTRHKDLVEEVGDVSPDDRSIDKIWLYHSG